MILRELLNKRLLTLALVMAMLLVVSGTALPDEGGCEMALVECWMDYWNLLDIAVIYCGTGYVFC
jgi:hypothetical protein